MSDASLMELLDEAYRCAIGGELDRATAAVAAARRWPPLREGSLESMDVMLVEGVVHTYRGETEAARNRLRRVIALAPLLPQSEAPLQAWGWLALLDYNQGEVLSAAEALAKACAQPERAGPRTRMRASVIAAFLCEFASLTVPARNWIAAARATAPLCRVPGIMRLVVYGLSAIRLTKGTVAELRNPVGVQDTRDLLLQVQSAIHYDAAAGFAARPWLHLLIRATALRLAGRPSEAVPLLERFLSNEVHSSEFDRLSARRELLACQVECGDHFDLDAVTLWLEASVGQFAEPNERAHVYKLLHELAVRRGGPYAGDWLVKSQAELSLHDLQCSELANRLTTLGLTTVPAAWTSVGADAAAR